MPKFRKKPIVVEAEQWWLGVEIEGVVPAPYDPFKPPIYGIKTLEGFMEVSEGDWIITGIKGEKYPCKPDIFEATYELVEAERSRAKAGGGAMNRTDTECQPCVNFINHPDMGNPHYCPECDRLRWFCQNCYRDHHEGGWNTCKLPKCRYSHPVCIANSEQRDRGEE